MSEGVQWLKGHPRDLPSATKCKHLQVERILQVMERPVQVAIEIGDGKPMVERIVVGVPGMAMICTSPEHLESYRKALTGDIAAQVQKVATCFDLCRICPFWQAEKGVKQ